LKLNIITGNKGFVGSNLVEYFENCNKIIKGVSRQPSNDEVSYQDLDMEIINTSKSFIHLAGKAHDLKKTSIDKAFFRYFN
jgi:nucleoside-diphosphate-sugar epimerase